MRACTRTGLITATLAVAAAGSPMLLASGDPEACSLLTTTAVSAALGVTVGPGETLHLATQPSNHGMCQWAQPNDAAGRGKKAQLDVFGPLGKLTPVNRFTDGKAPFPGITKVSVSGVGDDAYFTTNALGTSLTVRRGSAAFQVRVYGFGVEEAKVIEKNLALLTLARL